MILHLLFSALTTSSYLAEKGEHDTIRYRKNPFHFTKGDAMISDAVSLSKYIITKCIRDDCPISNLQLQKILYNIQKHYVKKDLVAFNDDIEAWKWGPVVPNSYYYFCGSGGMPIVLPYDETLSGNREVTAEIDPIIIEDRRKDPWDLVMETHKPGGAWDLVYDNGRGNKEIISLDLIKRAG